MYEIPTSIHINNIEYRIRNNGDYRMVLDCFSALQDAELTKKERLFACLIIFYQDFNSLEDVLIQPDLKSLIQKMYEFFNCGTEASLGAQTNHQLIDWEQDAQLICSAINKVANMEIRAAPYIHWWTFMGYYMSVGESVLSTVVGIRNKLLKGKELEKWEKEFKRDNPQYFNWRKKSNAELELDEYIKNLWNNGGEL